MPHVSGRQLWSLGRIRLGRELRVANCSLFNKQMWVGAPAFAGFCDVKSWSHGQLQGIHMVSINMNMERCVHDGPHKLIWVDFNTILSEGEGKAGYKSCREAGQEVNARIWTWDDGGLHKSRDTQIGFTRHFNVISTEFINDLVIEFKVMDDSCFVSAFETASLRSSRLDSTSLHTDGVWSALLSTHLYLPIAGLQPPTSSFWN